MFCNSDREEKFPASLPSYEEWLCAQDTPALPHWKYKSNKNIWENN